MKSMRDEIWSSRNPLARSSVSNRIDIKIDEAITDKVKYRIKNKMVYAEVFKIQNKIIKDEINRQNN
jgi:hypothetical protein